jgi:secreted trypsin-like serine protease
MFAKFGAVALAVITITLSSSSLCSAAFDEQEVFNLQPPSHHIPANLQLGNGENSRIVGGEEAIPNEFPWQAYLKVEVSDDRFYLCGGSLIADQWILTAAHCLTIPK